MPAVALSPVISMIAILIPVAFVGGYSTALLTQQSACQQHLSIAGLSKGGGDGRQLSHSAEQEGTLSLIEAGAHFPLIVGITPTMWL